MHMPGLRRARETALLTQAELAERAGVQRATVNRIETGATAARFATVRRLAEALGVPAADLLSPAAAPGTAAAETDGGGR